MADVKDLFKGIGVIIDDKINCQDETQDKILKIANELQRNNIPLLKFERIPDNEILPHLYSINFIILDWDLRKPELPTGIISSELEKETEKQIIQFLSELKKYCYAPIFLFTNNGALEKLRKKLVEAVEGKLPILVKNKGELFDDKGNSILWETLQDWLDQSSGIYVQKAWNLAFEKARTKFSGELNLNAHWPKFLYETIETDGVDPSEELNDLIQQNLRSRMSPILFEKQQIMKDQEVHTKEKMQQIISARCFCPEGSLSGHFSTGDIFKINDNLFVNIRPACDCVPRGDFDNSLHLLKLKKYSNRDIKKVYENKYGNFKENDSYTFIGPLWEGKFYSIQFNTLLVLKITDEFSRVGRIQHPYITRIIQKYGLYIQRQGLPRMPKHALYTSEEIERMVEEEQNKKKDTRK